jgi:hypothetical protein
MVCLLLPLLPPLLLLLLLLQPMHGHKMQEVRVLLAARPRGTGPGHQQIKNKARQLQVPVVAVRCWGSADRLQLLLCEQAHGLLLRLFRFAVGRVEL